MAHEHDEGPGPPPGIVVEFMTEKERDIVTRTPEDGFIAKFEQWVAGQSDAVSYSVKAAALTALSLTAGETLVLPDPFKVDGATYMNLYVVIVGDSTRARKSHVLSLMRSVLPVNVMDGKPYVNTVDDVSIQALNKALGKAAEQQRVTLFSLDEFAGLLEQASRPGSYLGGIKQALMKAYDHHPIHIARTGGRLDVDEGAFMCVFATTTPEPLARALSAEDVASGLVPRFLVFDIQDVQLPPRIPLHERMTPKHVEKSGAMLVELQEHLQSLTPAWDGKWVNNGGKFDQRKMKVTAEAMKRLDLFDDWNRAASDAAPNDAGLNAVRHRALVQAYRLGGLYALSRGGADAQVELIDMLRGIWLVENTVNDALRLAKELGDTPEQRNVRDALTWLYTRKTLPARKSDLWRSLELPAIAKRDVEIALASRGLIKESSDANGNIVWDLTPEGRIEAKRGEVR